MRNAAFRLALHRQVTHRQGFWADDGQAGDYQNSSAAGLAILEDDLVACGLDEQRFPLGHTAERLHFLLQFEFAGRGTCSQSEG